MTIRDTRIAIASSCVDGGVPVFTLRDTNDIVESASISSICDSWKHLLFLKDLWQNMIVDLFCLGLLLLGRH